MIAGSEGQIPPFSAVTTFVALSVLELRTVTKSKLKSTAKLKARSMKAKREGRRSWVEGQGTRDEGRGTKAKDDGEVRSSKDEGRRTKDEGRGTRDEGETKAKDEGERLLQ